jgi:hypothetical protein
MKYAFALFLGLLILSSCKKKDLAFPGSVSYLDVFYENFESEAGWTYYTLSFDSLGYPDGHDSVDFAFENGLAEVIAIQDNQCARGVLDKHLDRHEQIRKSILNDTVFVSFKIKNVSQIESGWSSLVLALDSHVLTFSFDEIDTSTTYTFQIAEWKVYNLVTQGNPNASFRTEYSNISEPLGTNKVLLKAEACRGSNYADARMVFDEIIIQVKLTAV